MRSVSIELDSDSGVAKVRAISSRDVVRVCVAHSMTDLQQQLLSWQGFLDACGFAPDRATARIMEWYAPHLPISLCAASFPRELAEALEESEIETLAKMLAAGGEAPHYEHYERASSLVEKGLVYLGTRGLLNFPIKTLTHLGFGAAQYSRDRLLDTHKAYCLCCKHITPIAGVIDRGGGDCAYFCAACQGSGTVKFAQQMAVLV